MKFTMRKTYKTTDTEEVLIADSHMKSKTVNSIQTNGNKIALGAILN